MFEWLDQAIRRSEAGEALAVCTVVETRGSTPQKAGAVMLVLANGRTIGTIGGGCVEAEVRSRAICGVGRSASRLMRFTLNQDYGWDDGLVCGGVMEVAVETREPAELADALQALRGELAAGRSASRTIRVVDEAGRARDFLQELVPPPRLIIAGGGHVGAALAELATPMGFAVVVVDDREDVASAERFPAARCVVGSIEAELSAMSLGPHDYVVIVTRGHRHDGLALAAVIGRGAGYVGLIGSRHKIGAIFRRLREDGVASDEQLESVHAPIGLDIGAVTPEEIAVSIAAELVAVRRGRGRGGADGEAEAWRERGQRVG